MLVDFPWRKDIVEYISSSQRTKKEKDTSVVALINLKIEVYARTIASLFAKCIADENVWDILETHDRVAKAIQRVREDANKTILNERDKIDETKGDKELIDVSHLQELVNEATLNIQHRIGGQRVYIANIHFGTVGNTPRSLLPIGKRGKQLPKRSMPGKRTNHLRSIWS